MRLILSILLLFALSGNASGQEPNLDYPSVEINIDSIIQDSLRQAFILNHKPLTEVEKAAIAFQKSYSAYGEYANNFLRQVEWYNLGIPQGSLYSPKRVREPLEWVFYSFLFLFLFTALLGKYSNGLLRKLWKIYVNDGFIFRQSKEQMHQQPLFSMALNLLFIFSSGLFVFFGLNWDHQFTGNMRWLILATSFLVIAFVYLFKLVLFKILGWAFGQEEAFEDYLFVVFLNNKLAGLIFLFSSFVMAFSAISFSAIVFRLTLFGFVLMMAYRFLRGYQVFSKQSRIGFFTLILAFIALELIPTAVVVKFLTKTIDLYLTGMS